MTKLLATIESVAALAYARRLIERGHRVDENSSSFFEAPQSQTFVRSLFSMMMLTEEGRLQLLAYARAGEEYAQKIIREALFELKTRGAPLPGEFINYDMELTAGMIPKPLTFSGPDQRDTLLRDISIAATVAAVCDRFYLKPTGRSARKRSACAVVAEALGAVGKQMSPKAVEEVWRRYKRGMPTRPGWTFSLENQ
jgi:hypothetical protein